MNRIMIIGCSGAGKSTFARKLHAITKIKLIHLDQYFWQPNWVKTETIAWKEIVYRLTKQPTWIMDGNYGGTMDIRMKRADTIIYLDYPTWTCLWRVTNRTFKNWGKRRFDMPNGCEERFDLKFFHYVATFNHLRRKKLLNKLNQCNEEKKIFVFRNDKQANRFLENLPIGEKKE